MLRQIIEIIPFYLLISVLKTLKFEKRVIFGGWLLKVTLPIIPKFRRRIQENLKIVYPEITNVEMRTFISKNAEMIGRSFVELMFNAEFHNEMGRFIYNDDDLDPIIEAKKKDRPVIIVSGHIGSWEGVRAVLKKNNLTTGALYQKNHNRFYENLHLKAIKHGGEPIFQVSPTGTKNMISFIKNGGIVALMIDQAVKDGKYMNFLGRPAKTSISIANIALKYQALLVPAYGIRNNDNRILVRFEKPIKLTKATTITHLLNRSLERKIIEHPTQWYWPHRRWK